MAQFIISAFADEACDSLQGQLAALKRNGLRYLEPRSIDGGFYKKTDEELKEIRRALDEAGIRISALGSPIGKFDIDKDFSEHLESYRRVLRACEILGCPRVRMFSFFVPQDRLSECREEVLRRMRILLFMAREAGVTLCHENESLIYGQNPAQVADLFQSLPELRGVFDAANYVMNDQDPVKGFEATLPRLEYLHIKDARAEEKQIVPVGKGDGCYEEILQRVDAATDRTVFLTLEPHLHIFEAYKSIDSHTLNNAYSFASSDEAFDCAVAHLKELLTKIGFGEGEDGIWKK